MAGRSFKAKRPACSFSYVPTKVDKLAAAITCATMNPNIDPGSFERSYGLKLSDVLARIEADRAKGGALL